MPSTGIGVYKGSADLSENDEVSSTYEGRHLTFLESDITGHEHTWVTKGHPVVVGEHIVGVAFLTGTAATDKIAIDTEGIWALSVVATDEDGPNAVVAGDELFIHKTTAIISKNANKVSHTRFGYALGSITTGTLVIAVKVHWNPGDEYELVGQAGALSVGTDASHRFREYHYEAQGGSYPHGDHLELTVTTLSCNSAQALVRKLLWTADDNWVTGYAAVGEFELIVAGGNATMDTCCILHLTSQIGPLTGTGHNNYILTWLWCHDYAAGVGDQVNNLFSITDDLGTYPAANDATTLVTASSGDLAVTHTIKILINAVNYWILLRNTN